MSTEGLAVIVADDQARDTDILGGYVGMAGAGMHAPPKMAGRGFCGRRYDGCTVHDAGRNPPRVQAAMVGAPA